MEALLHVPTNEGKHQTFRLSLTDGTAPPALTECKDCRLQESGIPEKKWKSSESFKNARRIFTLFNQNFVLRLILERMSLRMNTFCVCVYVIFLWLVEGTLVWINIHRILYFEESGRVNKQLDFCGGFVTLLFSWLDRTCDGRFLQLLLDLEFPFSFFSYFPIRKCECSLFTSKKIKIKIQMNVVWARGMIRTWPGTAKSTLAFTKVPAVRAEMGDYG